MTAQPDHDEVVRQSFEKQVGLFDGDDALFARRADPAVSWLGPLSPDMIVLDVACGAGHVAETVAPYVRQVVGVDVTPALLALGSARLSDAGVRNVLLLDGNAARLPFVDASFDVVACRTALHHFGDQEKAVSEMARVCRPGGRVVVNDLVAPNADVRDAFDGLHRLIDPSHAGVLLPNELSELLASAVGPVASAETTKPFRLPIDVMLTDAADREAVMVALHAELDGGPPSGFEPVLDDGRMTVAFTATTVQAVRDA